MKLTTFAGEKGEKSETGKYTGQQAVFGKW
jgi:hypothetical protein